MLNHFKYMLDINVHKQIKELNLIVEFVMNLLRLFQLKKVIIFNKINLVIEKAS